MDIQQLEIGRKKGPALPHATSSVRVPSLSIDAGTNDGSLDSNREGDMKYLQSFAPVQSERGFIRHEANEPEREPLVVLLEGGQVTINVRLDHNQSSDVISKVNT